MPKQRYAVCEGYQPAAEGEAFGSLGAARRSAQLDANRDHMSYVIVKRRWLGGWKRVEVVERQQGS